MSLSPKGFPNQGLLYPDQGLLYPNQGILYPNQCLLYPIGIPIRAYPPIGRSGLIISQSG